MSDESDRPSGSREDAVTAATNALKDATLALTSLISNEVRSGIQGASASMALGLKEASQDLADAAQSVAQVGIGQGQADLRASARAKRRSERAEQTRQEILVAALRVFAERGYEGASVGDIAAAAGFTKGALYAHFASKEELFITLALCAQGDDRDGGEIDETAANLSLLEQVAKGMREDADTQVTLFGLEVYSFAVRHPEHREVLMPALRAAMQQTTKRQRNQRRTRMSSDASGEQGDEGAEYTQDDWDFTFAVSALSTIASIWAAVGIPEDESLGAAERTIRRLLED